MGTPLHLFDKQRIENLVQVPGLHFEIFESIASTNDYLKNHPSLEPLTVCLAEHQIKGRGRLGKPWVSPFGKNIYCSLSYSFQKDVRELSGLSLVVGILVAEALESLDPEIKPKLKWPNDIKIDHQKVGGILVETLAEAHGECKAIIGLGLNVNMKNEILDEVHQPWTSLEHVLHKPLDRTVILAQILQFLLQGLELFAHGGFDPFWGRWAKFDLLKGTSVSIHTLGKENTGVVQGITKEGYLKVELPSGDIHTFASGDVLEPVR